MTGVQTCALPISRDDITKDLSPVNKFTKAHKLVVIWNYYRSFCKADNTPKKVVKHYANELKSQLELLGVDGLYDYILNQPHI